MPSLIETYKKLSARDCIERDAAQEAVVERLDALREALGRLNRSGRWLRRSTPPPRGVYLWGAVGRGKSMLMEMSVGALGDTPRRRVHFHVFMQEIHAALHAARSAGEDDPVAGATDRVTKGLKVLALDEMEITDVADATILVRVFERLLEVGTVPVVTSNRPPQDLYRDGLKRELFLPCISLIESRLDVLQLDGGEDFRRRSGFDETVFLVPANDEARARMDALWRDLTAEGERRLDLGHGAVVATNGARAARADFGDLCDRPLGSAEYLKLVEAIDLLVLDGVPRLGEKRHDAARRFVTLVDVLYDAGCGLVASAEDAPERLHEEGEGAFEFQRTASRLAEMQSPGWPGRAALRDLR